MDYIYPLKCLLLKLNSLLNNTQHFFFLSNQSGICGKFGRTCVQQTDNVEMNHTKLVGFLLCIKLFDRTLITQVPSANSPLII